MIKQNTNQNKQQSRNIGIEVLRILSMFMIVTIHLVGLGGITRERFFFSVNYNLGVILYYLCFVCVNVYGIITGYVYVNSKHKYSKILELWIKVFFYSVSLTILNYIIFPQDFSAKELIKSFIPLISVKYWYFTSYFGLFFFIPFLNSLIQKLSKQNYKKLIITIIILFSVIGYIGFIAGFNTFTLSSGYSLIWLMALYLIGAYLKLYGSDFDKYNKKYFILIYFLTSFAMFILNYFVKLYNNKFGTQIGLDLGEVSSYLSPFTLLGAICLLLYFSRLKINKFAKTITTISSLSFSIYLIHAHTFITNTFIIDKFTKLVFINPFLMIFFVLLSSLAIYVICIIIDYIREKLFKILHIKEFCERITNNIIKHTKKLLSC